MTDGNLTKGALVEEVADAAGLTKKRAEVIVDTLFGSITEALHQGEKVELRGFGVSVSGAASRAVAAIPGPASGWTCRRGASPTSRPARS